MAEPTSVAATSGLAAPSRLYQFCAFASILLLFLYSGYCIQALPVVAPSALKHWNLTADALKWPLAMIAVGTGLGSVVGGFIADAIGRKLPIIGFTALQGLCMFASGFATGPTGLLAPMFAIGLALGGYFSSGMAMLTELAKPHRRGLMVSLAMLFAPLGLSLCSLIAGYVAPQYGWGYVLVIGGLLSIPLLFALTFLVPESPKYLMRFPHKADAHAKVMARLGLVHEDVPPGDGKKGGPGLALIGKLLKERMLASVSLWLLFFVMYILGSVVLSWTPVVFTSLGFDIAFASRTLFYWTLGSMSGTFVAGWVMVRIGATDTATVYAIATVIVLAILTFVKLDPSVQWLAIALLPAAGFSVAGVVTTLYTLSTEIYPTAMRATGIGISDAVGRVGGVVSAFLGVYMLKLSGAFGFFGTLLGLGVVTLAILLFLRQYKEKFAAA